MKRISLNGEWKVTGISPDNKKINIIGNVPGSALNDLLCAGIEPEAQDIFWRNNTDVYQKYEKYNWIYTKKFSSDESKMVLLTFKRLDTFCDVYLNEKYLGSTDNAFITHTFQAEVKEGENVLEIYFTSPALITNNKKRKPAAFGTPERLYVRRSQCTYGWDWTARYVTCGIGDDVYMEEIYEGISVNSAYIYTKNIYNNIAELEIDVSFDNYSEGSVVEYEISEKNGDILRTIHKFCREDSANLTVCLQNPKLWYPNGYGEQPLHILTIRANGRELYSSEFGIRTVRVLEIPDSKDGEYYKKALTLKQNSFVHYANLDDAFSGFILEINSVKILCRGANWVPCEPFDNGSTDQKITEILELSAKAGVNMIRIWGGGKFESEHFYDECSRLGITVTQDFLMACADYPEKEEWFLNQLRREAEYISLLIRNKPCLVWWTGDNENATGGSDKDWDYNGRDSAYKAIAPILRKNDRNRRFLPSSPYGGNKYVSTTVGTTHNTCFLNKFFEYTDKEDLSDYKDYFKLYSARFIAEEPVMGAVDESSLKKFMTDEDIFGNDMSMWFYHNKTNPYMPKHLMDYIMDFARKILGEFTDSHDRLYKFQYVQYEWLRVSLERVLREKWFSSGVIYWMLNDCWPASAGWSIIDYYCNPKAAYYSLKRCCKNLVLSIDKENDSYNIHVCNNCREKSIRIKYMLVDKNGSICKTFEEVNFNAPNNASEVAVRIDKSAVSNDCFIVAEAYGADLLDRAFYKDGTLNMYRSDERIESVKIDTSSITIKANSYIHAIKLCGDAKFEENWFSLMPGETITVNLEKESNSDISLVAYSI
jgi:beta-mannosidase